MRIAILSFPPQPTPPDLIAALESAGMEMLDFSLDKPLEGLRSTQACIFIGDAVGSQDRPLAQSLISVLQAEQAQGKPLLGLGYGAAKTLAATGLIPGLYKNLVGLELSPPQDKQPEGEDPISWMRLAHEYQLNAFTRGLSPRELLPLRRAPGAAFIIPPGLLLEMQSQGQLVFLFCEADGCLLPGPAIAAVSNKAGQVLALLGEPQALTLSLLFKSLRCHLESPPPPPVEPLYYWPRK